MISTGKKERKVERKNETHRQTKKQKNEENRYTKERTNG